MQESIDDNLLFRFLNRETTESEDKEILQWVSVSEENRNEFKRIHQLFHLSDLEHYQSAIDIDKAWDKLSDQITTKQKKARIINMNLFMKVAVSVLILVAFGLGSLWTRENGFKNQKSSIVLFEAPNGEKCKIILADGSHVWLNSKTTLKYDALNPRNVILDGEAYFEIEKDANHPFEVITESGMHVKVTGTKFNLRSFSDETYVETTLEEGGVIITKDDNEMAALKPGQQANYDTRSNKIRVDNVSTEIYSLWKNNELQISGSTFKELVPRIERWYGITMSLDPNISENDRFTMTIKTESLRELLNMMQLTSKFSYEINGEKVDIRAK